MVIAQPLFSEAASLHRKGLNVAPRGFLGGLCQCFGTWYYGLRHSAEVSRQLRSRTVESRSLWAAAGYDLEIVEKVCQAIQAACGWPNHLFVPDDPIDVVMDVPFDALAIVEFLSECEERVGVRLQPGAMHDAETVGDAVRIVTEVVHGTIAHQAG